MKDFGITDSKVVLHVGECIEKDMGLVSTVGLGGGLYTLFHAMGNLPTEYVEMLALSISSFSSGWSSTASATITTNRQAHGDRSK